MSRALPNLFTWRTAAVLLAAWLAGAGRAQTETDYTVPASPFPRIYRPYQQPLIPEPDLSSAGSQPLVVADGKLRLSMAQVVAAVVENNLTVAAARYNPSIAQADLLRARSGNSPRGVDASQIPSGVFSGAVGGSILESAGGGGGGSFKAGGITGSAGSVSIRPSGLFDPSLSVNFSMERITSPLNTVVVAGVPSVATHTLAFSANYAQAFSSGTSFTISYAMQRQASTQLHLLYNPDFAPGFTATVSQQLAKGFGFDVNRVLIKVAENERKIERESFRQQVIAALVNAQNAYWDLVAAQDAVRSAEKAVAVAQELERQNRRQLEIGTMALLDVASAQSQVAASQRDLIVAQTSARNLELQVKAMIARRMEEPMASAPIETTDMLPEPEDAQIPVPEEASAIAMQNRPEISIAQGNLKSQVDSLPFIRNELLPNVSVFALVTTVGLYNVFGTSFVDAIHFKYPEVAFGATVTFPLRNRQAQADDVRSRLEWKQAKDTLVGTSRNVDVDVQNAVIALNQSKAQVAAAHEAVRLERRKLEAEQTKLAAGLSTSYNVILTQRDLLAAELADVQARDGFAKARVTLAHAMGTTLETNRVDLDQALAGRMR